MRITCETPVTVVVVPRERFSCTVPSLESLLADRSHPFHLIYVDGGSPPAVRNYLDRQADRYEFSLLRTPGYVSPNQARNLGLRSVHTPYVLFIDNDVIVQPGWLGRLMDCATTTGASIVGPVYCAGEPGTDIIHMAGGLAHFDQEDGRRVFIERHLHVHKRLADIRPLLQRGPCELVEFHCMLVRRSVFEQVGPLDEGLLSSPEHVDLCLSVRAHGGTVYLEPDAVVTYVTGTPLSWSDLPFYMLRWSDRWNRASMARFRAKWRLEEDDPFILAHSAFLAAHRRVYAQSWSALARRAAGWRRGTWIAETTETLFNRALVPMFIRPYRPTVCKGA